MAGERVDYNPNAEDGRGIVIHGDGCLIRCDVVRAQLIAVQLDRAITAAALHSPPRAARAGDPGRLSQRQLRKILVMFGEMNVKDRAFRLRAVSEIVGRDVATTNDLTGAEAHRVIDHLVAVEERVQAAARVLAPSGAEDPF